MTRATTDDFIAAPTSDEFEEHSEPFRSRVARFLSFRNASALYVLGGFIVIFGIWTPETFLTWQTLRSVLSEQSVSALLAVGLVLPLAGGAFDLSVAATMGLASALAAVLMAQHDVPWGLAVLAVLATGTLVGASNGVLVEAFRVPSMIATLAMSSVLAGVATGVGGDNVIVDISPQFVELGQTTLLGLQLPFYVLVGVSVALSYLLSQTTTGRYIYATGGGADAARLAGVPTRKIMIFVLTASGLLAAFAGLVATARVGAGQAALGPPYLLPAFAAAFLGATQFGRGQFNVAGTILAAYTLAVGVKGLQLAGAPLWLPGVFNGAALALAVALSAHQRGGSRAARRALGRLRRGRHRDSLGDADGEIPTPARSGRMDQTDP